MRKPPCPSADIQELPVQDGEQPRLDLAAVPQLVPFGRTDIEWLLGKIARVCLSARQAEGKSVQRLIVLGHYLFKIIRRHHAIPLALFDTPSSSLEMIGAQRDYRPIRRCGFVQGGL